MANEEELPLGLGNENDDGSAAEPVLEAQAQESSAEGSAEPDPGEELRKENEALRTQLNEIVRMRGGREDPTPPQPTSPPQPSPAEIDFTQGVSVADLFDAPGPVLNTLLNKVYHAGREAAMQEIPALVQAHAAQTVDLRMKAKQFWDDNADLKEFADFVGLIANSVAQENPTLGLDDVYKETASRARARLKLIKGGQPSAPSTSPALPGTHSGRKPAVTPKPLAGEAKEMEDMWKTFGG